MQEFPVHCGGSWTHRLSVGLVQSPLRWQLLVIRGLHVPVFAETHKLLVEAIKVPSWGLALLRQQIGTSRITVLLFADDVALLASDHDFQHALRQTEAVSVK